MSAAVHRCVRVVLAGIKSDPNVLLLVLCLPNFRWDIRCRSRWVYCVAVNVCELYWTDEISGNGLRRSIGARVCVCVCRCMRRFVRVCECVYAYACLCVSEFVYRLVRVCVCVRAYIHLCVCVLVYMSRSDECCVSRRSLLLDFRLGVCAPCRLCPGALQYSKLNLPFVHIYICIMRTSVWCTSFPPPRCWGGSRENT